MGLTSWAVGTLAGSIALCVYSYAGYPLLLKLLGRLRRRAPSAVLPADGVERGPGGDDHAPDEWPAVSIVLPVYNEAATITAALEAILAADYPPGRRQILVISDASSDGTNEIVAGFASRGVELLRMPVRGGKTAAENAACAHLTGAIVIGTDASVRLHPDAIKCLVRALEDPDVGVASGCDVSVAHVDRPEPSGEASYVGYEMRTRDLETAMGGIVGASGCLYAIRAPLYRRVVPPMLSRDFAAALHAREHGFAAVSVPQAICFVPRSNSFEAEYRRKVRTIERGLATLFHHRRLLNPLRYGRFAWMLVSHKLCRWMVPWAVVIGIAAIAALALEVRFARWIGAGALAGLIVSLLACASARVRLLPGLSLVAYGMAGTAAALHAWVRLLSGRRRPTWEPTRRDVGVPTNLPAGRT